MPLTPATRQELKTLYNALADRVLEPDDPVYVKDVNCRGNTDAVEEIATEIEWQDGGGVCLFTGQRGTGKSTELRRLKKRLEEAGCIALYADLAEYLLLTKEVEISDFLVSLAGAMSEQVQALYGGSPGNTSYWERFKSFLQTEVEFTEIGGSLAGIEIKAALKNDPDFKRRVQEAARGHVAQLVDQAHQFLIEAVQFVRQRSGNQHCKVVLLVDSVERIRGVGNEAMAVYESVRNLFFGHAEHLKVPLLHIVYTIPPYLSVLAAGAGTLMGGAVPRRLVSTHIFKDRSREPDPAGLQVLREVVAVRYPGWSSLFQVAALDILAASSGGDLREFFRLVRLCLPAVRDQSQLPLSAEAVRPALNAARAEMLPIPADHLRWLHRIASTHDTCLEKDADLPALAHFLDNRLVLNYRNGTDWYDVHPLLRDVVDAHGPIGA
jgi:AAA ATPase domain